jgi:hypothetical protein
MAVQDARTGPRRLARALTVTTTIVSLTVRSAPMPAPEENRLYD